MTTSRIDRTDLYIGGKFSNAESAKRVESINPATEEVVGSVPDANEADVDRAVRAARDALPDWAATPAPERGRILGATAKALEARTAELMALVSAQNGAPQWWAQQDVGIGALLYHQAAADAAALQQEELVEGAGRRTLLRREPVGVVGAIAPWNSPQALLGLKVANAVAAGCTVVAKPSPETSLDTYLLAEAFQEAGLPPGVLNIVTGGPTTGMSVVSHPGVDKISFTGSTVAGTTIAVECARTLKPVIAEMGGKSAAVLLDDADLDDFVASIQRECLPFSGQACFVTARVIVPRGMHEEFLERTAAALGALPFGDPSDPETIMGPLVSARQRERVEGYLRSGVEQGARLVMGGGRGEGFDRGYYIAPTIFTDTDPSMSIFTEEIFGPVLVVATYGTEDEAVALHDATDFGLSGSVFSKDVERATAFSRRLDTGQLLVNGHRGAPNAIRDMYGSSALNGGVDRIAGFTKTKGISQP